MKKDQRRIKISLDVTPGLDDRVERLEQGVEGGSKASLIRQALQLYEHVARRRLDGATFKVVHQDQEESLASFGFPTDDRELRP